MESAQTAAWRKAEEQKGRDLALACFAIMDAEESSRNDLIRIRKEMGKNLEHVNRLRNEFVTAMERFDCAENIYNGIEKIAFMSRTRQNDTEWARIRGEWCRASRVAVDALSAYAEALPPFIWATA